MALMLAKCPACGADLNIETQSDHLFCPYCGSKVVKQSDKIVIETVTRHIEEHVTRTENSKDAVKLKRIEVFDKLFNPSQEVLDRRKKEAEEKRERNRKEGAKGDFALGIFFLGFGVVVCARGPAGIGGMFICIGIACIVHGFINQK